MTLAGDIPVWQLTPALDALAEELGVDEGDLDEAVLEAVHDKAADAYNNGAYCELGDEDAHDQVHDDADERASSINASVTDQLAFLAGGCASEQDLRSLLANLLT
ncbi:MULTISPECIES: hypothetical protein [unclassified Streptomyces]|uniref:hypothetical protein n=1 Tax=unclassified Streptomyces TaxID=2593676 RepID=UPI00081DA926|nr:MULTISPECIES: hypothetical protein [unclassified Streptomyces]MYZ33744.1 hypothetical protein [Streptomyces sp. SID4917]SCF61458.1 hypothetical protein GA0115259_1001715 [Streptomyces sp. MnatMP-M17]